MLETTTRSQPAHPAATVVLVRDGRNGLEALLVQRSAAVRHMGGMWVFPGGRVDPGDLDNAADELEAARNAAVRETREEAGLELCREQLVYMSHWTTPEGAKKRFATWFFLGILEPGQEVSVDGGEIARHRWVTPAQALAELADPDHPFSLMPPTFVSLLDIADYRRCEDAHAALLRREPMRFAPRMVFVEDGICFLYEGDAGFEDEELDAPGSRHRTYMINGQLDYVRRD